MLIEDTWLPKCLAHLNEPYLRDVDESVIIGQLSSNDKDGYSGFIKLHTALVPVDRLDEVVCASGGIGSEVKCWGPDPDVDEGRIYNSGFWVEGPNGKKDRLEPLVVGWTHHNKIVIMPDNGLLMCYGLSPRVQKGPDEIVWDNLSRPEYGVVSVKPLSHYTVPQNYSVAEVRITRRYLEDFASLKGCAVVAVFYEERRCMLDKDIEAILDRRDAVDFKLPGRRLIIMRSDCNKKNPILCQVWGCRLILVPSGRPVSEEKDPEFEWPGFPGVMTYIRAASIFTIDYVCVSDQALEEFEGKPEYKVDPVSGSVSYDGWWSLSSCFRIGRDYIAYRIKYLYEGCSPYIIEHVRRFAVDEEVARLQTQTLGQQNIGKRAEALIEAFFEIGEELAGLSNLFYFPFESEDIISYDKHDISYRGWQTINNLAPLGWRAPLDMKRNQFLERCKTVYQLFEGLREKPLRRLLIEIGLPENEVAEFRSLKLFACLMQLCEISLESGLDIHEHRVEVVSRWNKDMCLDELKPLFALVDLRNSAGHSQSSNGTERVRNALGVYNIDENQMNTGWGIAVDQIYDHLTACLCELASTLNRCRLNSDY